MPKDQTMTLVAQLSDYIHAAFTGLWVQTCEPEEAERELTEHGRRFDWTVAVWDLARGLRLSGAAVVARPDLNDPVLVLRALPTLAPPAPAAEKEPGTTLLLLPQRRDFRYLSELGRINSSVPHRFRKELC